MLNVNISDIAITTIVDYRWLIYDISKSEAIQLLKSSELDDRGHT